MKFKDQLKKDLNVFFNLDEFAEKVVIDGQMVSVVIDNDLLREHQLKNGGEGLANSELLFHVQKSALKEKPFVGKHMRYNQKLYRISDIQENHEMYTITLEGYRS